MLQVHILYSVCMYVYMNRETRYACALLQARQQQVVMAAVHC